jgi:hypothetical protein
MKLKCIFLAYKQFSLQFRFQFPYTDSMRTLGFFLVSLLCFSVPAAFAQTAENQAPRASLSVFPIYVDAGEEVVLDGSLSSDPEGDDLTYYWDLDGDRVADDSGSNPYYFHRFNESVSVGLQVADSTGLRSEWASANVFVRNTNQAPSVKLTAPEEGEFFFRSLKLSADASDDGEVARVDFYVDDVLVASDDTAPYSATYRVKGRPSSGDHVVRAEAVDNTGLTSSDSVAVRQVAPGSQGEKKVEKGECKEDSCPIE